MTPPPEPVSNAQKDTVTINVDGTEVEARPGELVIAAAERTGTYIPRFCYHPRMESVGMCRMCLVNVEGPRGTSLQVSCMLTCSEGMKVDTKAPEVKKAQDGVLEFLLINHPLDCPVCDKGGECPLQDQTLAFGPGETRFVEEKRHFEKPIDISPLVALDRERCILCDRCTRFSKDVAGDPLIAFQDRGNGMQVNTFPGHPFASYFSGNTVQICPVGALTATPYRFKARPWDLEQVESTCTSCSFGCRVAVQSSSDSVTRYLGIDAEPTNHGWLCDKGRFDFEALSSDARISAPLMRKTTNGDGNLGERALGEPVLDEQVLGEQVVVSWGEALAAAASAISDAGPHRVGVIGGARLPNEDQYVWAKLAKSVIGTDNVDAQLGDGLPAPSVLGVPRATIDDACNAKAVVLIAPDIKEELPVLYLRLREAILGRGLVLFEITPQPTSLSSLATHSLVYHAGDAAGVVNALVGRSEGEVGGVPAADIAAARDALKAAGDVVVVAGRQSVAESPQAVADSIGLLAKYSNARFLSALRRSNVLGALDMGLAPGVLPGRVSLAEARAWYSQAWGKVPAQIGLDTGGILQAAAQGDLDVVLLLGADPLRDYPDRELARDAFTRLSTVIAVDTTANASTEKARIILPAAGYAERTGTTTNIEGRITRLGQKVTPPGVAWPDWMIAVELAHQLGSDLGFESLVDIWTEIEQVAPSHFGITTAVLNDRSHRDGVVAPYDPSGSSAPSGRAEGAPFTDTSSGSSTNVPALDPEAWPGIGEVEWHGDPNTATAMSPAETDSTRARVAMRPSGVVPPPIEFRVTEPSPPAPLEGYSVRLVATRKLYDQGTLVQNSPHLAGLVGDHDVRVHPSTIAPLGIETGGRVRLRNGRGSLVVGVVADERVARGVAVLPFNVTTEGAADLIDASQPVTNVRVETP